MLILFLLLSYTITLYEFDWKQYKKTVDLQLEGETLKGFLSGAHIQWRYDYLNGTYFSHERPYGESTAELHFMKIDFKTGERKLKFRNLNIHYNSTEFIEGIFTYFEMYNLAPPYFVYFPDRTIATYDINEYNDYLSQEKVEKYLANNFVSLPENVDSFEFYWYLLHDDMAGNEKMEWIGVRGYSSLISYFYLHYNCDFIEKYGFYDYYDNNKCVHRDKKVAYRCGNILAKQREFSKYSIRSEGFQCPYALLLNVNDWPGPWHIIYTIRGKQRHLTDILIKAYEPDITKEMLDLMAAAGYNHMMDERVDLVTVQAMIDNNHLQMVKNWWKEEYRYKISFNQILDKQYIEMLDFLYTNQTLEPDFRRLFRLGRRRTIQWLVFRGYSYTCEDYIWAICDNQYYTAKGFWIDGCKISHKYTMIARLIEPRMLVFLYEKYPLEQLNPIIQKLKDHRYDRVSLFFSHITGQEHVKPAEISYQGFFNLISKFIRILSMLFNQEHD